MLRIARFGKKVYQNKSSHGTLVRGDDDSYHAINAVDDNINIDIDDKTGDVENVFKSDYNEKTLEDVVDGNVIKA